MQTRTILGISAMDARDNACRCRTAAPADGYRGRIEEGFASVGGKDG